MSPQAALKFKRISVLNRQDLGPCLQDETDLRPKLKLVFTKTRLKSVDKNDNREMIQVLFLKV